MRHILSVGITVWNGKSKHMDGVSVSVHRESDDHPGEIVEPPHHYWVSLEGDSFFRAQRMQRALARQHSPEAAEHQRGKRSRANYEHNIAASESAWERIASSLDELARRYA